MQAAAKSTAYCLLRDPEENPCIKPVKSYYLKILIYYKVQQLIFRRF